MTRLVWIVFLVAVGWTLPVAAASAETVIRCPLPQATRNVTERLPPNWWTTPVASRVTGTRIQQIGGRLALMCRYGEAGSIQRNAPHGQACTAIRGDFAAWTEPRRASAGPALVPRRRCCPRERLLWTSPICSPSTVGASTREGPISGSRRRMPPGTVFGRSRCASQRTGRILCLCQDQ